MPVDLAAQGRIRYKRLTKFLTSTEEPTRALRMLRRLAHALRLRFRFFPRSTSFVKASNFGSQNRLSICVIQCCWGKKNDDGHTTRSECLFLSSYPARSTSCDELTCLNYSRTMRRSKRLFMSSYPARSTSCNELTCLNYSATMIYAQRTSLRLARPIVALI